MGVPILRGGRVCGVLVIQHKNKRLYLEEEVETLQTISMVIAELMAAEQIDQGRENEEDLENLEKNVPMQNAGPLSVELQGSRFEIVCETPSSRKDDIDLSELHNELKDAAISAKERIGANHTQIHRRYSVTSMLLGKRLS
jgi:signal transduction protein with GAF and PtsI domain